MFTTLNFTAVVALAIGLPLAFLAWRGIAFALNRPKNNRVAAQLAPPAPLERAATRCPAPADVNRPHTGHVCGFHDEVAP